MEKEEKARFLGEMSGWRCAPFPEIRSTGGGVAAVKWRTCSIFKVLMPGFARNHNL